MNLTVKQDNLYLFLPSKVSRLADMIVSSCCMSIVEAVTAIYESNTYSRLEDESTKMWHLGPVDLYRDFRREGSALVKEEG